MNDVTNKATWPIDEALAISLVTLLDRIPQRALTDAFRALEDNRKKALVQHLALKDDIKNILDHVLGSSENDRRQLLSNAAVDKDLALVFMHIGMRWWLAREDMLAQPPGTLILREYAPGVSHYSLQLLAQMLYRGACPDKK